MLVKYFDYAQYTTSALTGLQVFMMGEHQQRRKECPECDKQALCTKGTYRQLHIQTREHLRCEIRQRLKSAEGKIKYLKRMLIESVFGNIKHNLNYEHLYLKGLEKTTAEWQLICIGHNLRKLHKLKMA